MSDLDEDTGYLVIKPGDRVFIEYDDPKYTEVIGGLGTVEQVVNPWTAKVKRDVDSEARTYMRMLLRKPD